MTPQVSVNGIIEEIIEHGIYTPKYAGEILELLADDSTGEAACNEFSEVIKELSKRHSRLRDSLNQTISELTKLRDSLPCAGRFSKYDESWSSLVNSALICAEGSFSVDEYTGENLLIELPTLSRLGSRESPNCWAVQVACGTDDRLRDYLITKTQECSRELFSEIATRLLALIAEDMAMVDISTEKCADMSVLVADMTTHIEEFAKMIPVKPKELPDDDELVDVSPKKKKLAHFADDEEEE